MRRYWARAAVYAVSGLVVVGLVLGVLSTLAFLSNLVIEPASVRFFVFTAADVGRALSTPLGVGTVTVTLATLTGIAYVRGDQLRAGGYDVARTIGATAGLLPATPPRVSGAVLHEGVRWVGHYHEDDHIEVERRECPFCALELVEAHLPHTRLGDDEESPALGSVRWEVSREATADARAELVEALACPQCAFAVEGEKSHVPTDAVRSLLRPHFEVLTGAERTVWERRASERVGGEPGPGDLWDEYVLENDADSLVPVHAVETADGTETVTAGTYPALERLRESAEGIDWLVARASPTTGAVLARLFRSDYLRRKAELRAKRQSARDELIEGLWTLERSHGAVLTQGLLARREHRLVEDTGTRRAEVGSAIEYLAGLRDGLDDDLLSGGERRRLSNLEAQLKSVDVHLEAVEQYRTYRDRLDGLVEAFESRYEPYRTGDAYLPGDDEAFLQETAGEIRETVAEALARLETETLPADVVESLTDRRERFTAVPDELAAYNERFVERQRETFEEVLTTAHGPLNDSQQRAVIRNDRHNLVDASAGTGKTLTLTQRFLYLHRRGVPLDEIVAITFSGEAAAEMKERIAAAIDGVRSDSLNVSTFHSLALGIVNDSLVEPAEDVDMEEPWHDYLDGFLGRDSALEARHPEAMAAFTEHDERFRTALETRDERWAERVDHRSKYADFLETAQSFDRETDEIRDELTTANRVQYHFGLAACALLDAFREWCRSTDGPVGYYDMLKTATRLGRENPEYFGSRYQHVLFDEFQDVSRPVLDFVEIFLGGSSDTRLFAVGDDWQSIYGFRGSTPRFFIDFDERFDPVTETQLDVNYRCPPSVVEAGAALMAASEERQNEKEVRAFGDSVGPPVAHVFDATFEWRTAYAVQQVRRLVDTGVRPADVMVLAGQWKTVEPVAAGLERCGIPCSLGEGPGVTLQTVHKSKGTEAPHVFLLEATDDTEEGIPSRTWEDELTDVAKRSPNYYAEQRRLFYVAMTRAEERLHVFTEAGNESRYLEDIADHFEWREVDGLPARVTEWESPEAGSGQPYSGTVDFGTGEFGLVAWPDRAPAFDTGEWYRFTDFQVRDNGFGEEVALDRSTAVEQL